MICTSLRPWSMAAVAAYAMFAVANAGAKPNVILIIADDQGFGDLGVHGNPKIKTPNLDRLAGQGAEINTFYVSPVCTPTRACLMTGRYNYRTCAIDTSFGRAMMHPDETTLAEMLAEAGYATGIFGKWHLGDHYPLRAIDQGFQEALVLWGGGIGQPSDPPEGNSYFNPTLERNGKNVKTQGYVSDVITSAAIEFIEQVATEKPFFVYLPYNCPHTPLQVPESYYEPYRALNLTVKDFPQGANPIPPQRFDAQTTAQVYGMITNIDDNLGRLFRRLDELKLANDTIVVFITDNGPQQPRYVSHLRERKGSVYEGGIRAPCFVRWPAKIAAGRKVAGPAAHIDLTPTLLEACQATPPAGLKLDGRSVLPLLTGVADELPNRPYFVQWHRGDEPQRNRACAVRDGNLKLVQPLGSGDQPLTGEPKFELYDLAADPYETRDLSSEQPDSVARLRKMYEAWFADVSATRGYAPPEIIVGTAHENPVLLTRQDWRGRDRKGWAPNSVGHWVVRVAEPGAYTLRALIAAPGKPAKVRVTFQDFVVEREVAADATECVFSDVQLPVTAGNIEPTVLVDGKTQGVLYLQVARQ